VSKLPKEGDRRVSYVKLTQAGFNALENSPSLMHQQLSAKLQLLPDEELQNLDSSLRLLIHCLGIDQTEASAILTIEDPIMTDLHQK